MARKNEYISKIDKLVGEKIYSLRLAKGMSRQQLAAEISVTHQQLQKYEKGGNRISVGRLVLIAQALEKDIAYFYGDIKISDNINTNLETEELITKHQRMCIEVSRNFMRLKRPEHQIAISKLLKSLASNVEEES